MINSPTAKFSSMPFFPTIQYILITLFVSHKNALLEKNLLLKILVFRASANGQVIVFPNQTQNVTEQNHLNAYQSILHYK